MRNFVLFTILLFSLWLTNVSFGEIYPPEKPETLKAATERVIENSTEVMPGSKIVDKKPETLKATTDEDVELPSWVGDIVEFLKTIPYVGPVIVQILKWVGIVTAIFTALAAFLQTLCVVLIGSANLSGLQKFADVILRINEKVLPWLKYFSMFNVQKK